MSKTFAGERQGQLSTVIYRILRFNLLVQVLLTVAVHATYDGVKRTDEHTERRVSNSEGPPPQAAAWPGGSSLAGEAGAG